MSAALLSSAPDMARLALGLTLPTPDAGALSRVLPALLTSQLPQLLTSLLNPADGKAPMVRQWLLAALGARLQSKDISLPAPLKVLLQSLDEGQKQLLSDGLGKLEQAQFQSRQDTLFWALPLPFAQDWLELAWPNPKEQKRNQESEAVLTLLFPLPGLGRLLVKAGVQSVRFYADTPALKQRVDDTLPRFAKRLADLELAPQLMSFQGKVPAKLIPPVGGINELV
ncbi:MAG: flagellar hook-length control protein FliK [Pseudomonadota bacterium]|uniref:flagellar hook-length control protein FliK n=1 Tax=Gallaecimonas pentaromativorans TaxID=584787 RepID=UPI00067E8E9A|nr:flagellar hook-length control protein FliK [Gallaecimonas pentaromativorans]MED5526660.1 flagellar hook-length control protein FliK [Pseudomonadota bacterium]